MVLPSWAITDYMDRERDSFNWMKELNHDRLDEIIYKIKPRPKIINDLMLHQKVAFVLGCAYPQFLFWLDMGTGKTLITLELMNYFYNNYLMDRSLILAPNEASMYGWKKQIEKWNIPLPFVELPNGAIVDKWEALADGFKSPLILASYVGLMRMGTKGRTNKKGDRLAGWQPDDKKTKLLRRHIQGFVADESTEIGNHESLIHRVCRQISADCRIAYGLAGRPFGRDPTPLWAQYRVIDKGATLGPTLELFREAFFSSSKNFWSTSKHSKVYKFKDTMRPKLAKVMDHRSITYSIQECVDLPPMVRSRIESTLPQEAEAYYQKVVDEVRAAKGNFSAIKNSFMVMRQLSSGFLGFRDDENGDRIEVEFDENPKLDDLMAVVKSIPFDSKAIIFHEFTHSGRVLCKALKELKIGHAWIWGGEKNQDKIRDKFDDPDSGMQVLVLNHKIGAFSLDLPIANYEFFYESPVAVIRREQAERRAWRTGQKKTTFVYDSIVLGTMDERILEFHESGEDLFQALMRTPDKLTRRKS